MPVSHFVKRFVADRRHNSCDQLMSYTDIERVDVAVGAVSFTAGAFAVAVAVENGGVESDDFNKTII